MTNTKPIWKFREINTTHKLKQESFINGAMVASIVWAIALVLILEAGKL